MKLLILISLAILTSLGSCTTTAQKTYQLTPPATAGGRMCTLQCGEALRFCSQSCDFKQRECVQDKQTQAMHDYDKYTIEQFQSRQPIELHARDFERLGPCDDIKKDCIADCESNHRLCYENCGGAVTSTSSCQFLCF